MSNRGDMLDVEHEEILDQLRQATLEKNRSAKKFEEILSNFKNHLEKENYTIVPLLNYNKGRTESKYQLAEVAYLDAAKRFDDSYESMVEEHRLIQRLIREVQSLLQIEGNKKLSNTCNKLLHHIDLEEEFLYPAAKAACENIRFHQQIQRVPR